MSRLKVLLRLALLFSLTVCPFLATAGGSDGGTNLVISENELTDFVKFRKTYGDVLKPIAPRTSTETSAAYNAVKPLMARFRYLYPGIGNAMEDVFDKDWVLVEATFTPRNSSEIKPISQTENVVFVSLPWFKQASPEKIKKALLHEAIRNLAHRTIGFMIGHSSLPQPLGSGERLALEDQFTEDLTPLLYFNTPTKMLDQSVQSAFTNLVAGINHVESAEKLDTIDRNWHFTQRVELYGRLRNISGRKVIALLCEGIDEDTADGDALRTQISTRLRTLGSSYREYFKGTNVYPAEGEPFLAKRVDLDPEIETLMRFYRDIQIEAEYIDFKVFQACQTFASSKLALLTEFEQEKGLVHDPLSSK